nr:MAG TPA: hypothetical protein [Caudoviricetes sp.]
MKSLFTWMACLQVLLFIVLVYGVSRGILKDDVSVKIVKITTLIICMLSLYLVIKQ